jgi:CRP-like cAMP-binding protein
MVKLVYSFSEKTFKRNQTVYNEGEESQTIYVVKEGEFEVTRHRKMLKKSKSNVNHYKMIGPHEPTLFSNVQPK